jgi:RES domain-containing protein
MPIEKHIKPWSGHAVRHLPDVPGLDVYDFSMCGKSEENRWNVSGESTLYLAKDKSVALAEFARHFRDNRTPSLAGKTLPRKVYGLKVKLKHVLDLRDSKACRELSLAKAPECFLEKSVARATAHFIRNTTPAEGLLVPSIAFLDDLKKWCLVLFLEKLPKDRRKFLTGAKVEGTFKIG